MHRADAVIWKWCINRGPSGAGLQKMFLLFWWWRPGGGEESSGEMSAAERERGFISLECLRCHWKEPFGNCGLCGVGSDKSNCETRLVARTASMRGVT